MTETKTFVIADTHFYHRNIINLCNRPFWTDKCVWIEKDGTKKFEARPDVDYMNRKMVLNWNNVVGPDDDVYHLGDFMMGKCDIGGIFKRLNGHKYLLQGNHDHAATLALGWEHVHQSLMVLHGGRTVYMNHYPVMDWPERYRGSIHLYGHVHNNLNAKPMFPNAFNMGVELINYTPVNLNDIMANLENQVVD